MVTARFYEYFVQVDREMTIALVGTSLLGHSLGSSNNNNKEVHLDILYVEVLRF